MQRGLYYSYWEPSSIPTVTKDIRNTQVLMNEILDGLLVRVGNEINDGTPANVFNVILFPVLQIRFDRMPYSFYRLDCINSEPCPLVKLIFLQM